MCNMYQLIEEELAIFSMGGIIGNSLKISLCNDYVIVVRVRVIGLFMVYDLRVIISFAILLYPDYVWCKTYKDIRWQLNWSRTKIHNQNICIKISNPPPTSKAATPTFKLSKYRSLEFKKCKQGKYRNSILFKYIIHSSISSFHVKYACFSFFSFYKNYEPVIGSYFPYSATK